MGLKPLILFLFLCSLKAGVCLRLVLFWGLKTLTDIYRQLKLWVTADILHGIVKSMLEILGPCINFCLSLERTIPN